MKILSNKKYYELILKSCKGMFGAVTDDMLLRDNALLNEENKKLKEELKYTVPIVEHNKIVSKKLKENQKYKEVIDKVSSQIKLYGKYNGEKCTRGFSMMSADFNKLLEILKGEQK